jgi:hypothetical protein
MREGEDQAEQIFQRLQELEDQAGIRSKADRAREGSFIPLGALGDPATPDEYFADEYDHTRSGIRRAYFSVSDVDLRKQLINTQRKLEKLGSDGQTRDVNKARHALEVSKQESAKQPWGTAAAIAGGAVALGYYAFELVGALAGMVGGFFLGQGVIADARRRAADAITADQESLDAELETQSSNARKPSYFTYQEELSGEEDRQFSYQSATANLTNEERSPP